MSKIKYVTIPLTELNAMKQAVRYLVKMMKISECAGKCPVIKKVIETMTQKKGE